MRRIVLDTNCLLQVLPSHSPYHKIWTEILYGNIALCVNTEILIEYEEILTKKTTKEIAQFQETYIHFDLIEQDVDDNKFVDCAVAADAEYIVTNDSHFNVLKEIDWPKVAVLTIQEFASQIK